MNLIYELLLKKYGAQDWWPADTNFEVMIGAILTQNTNWKNVEKAITNLKQNDLISAEAIDKVSIDILAELIKPSGYFNMKAKRLKYFVSWYLENRGYKNLNKLQTLDLRNALLNVNGIGPETADDILLYAFERKVFVIDAYFKRIFSRLNFIAGDEKYEDLRSYAEKEFRGGVQEYQEYHALLVEHAKLHCKVKPACDDCCIKSKCKYHV